MEPKALPITGTFLSEVTSILRGKSGTILAGMFSSSSALVHSNENERQLTLKPQCCALTRRLCGAIAPRTENVADSFSF